MPHVLAGLRMGKEVEFTWQVTQEDIDAGEREDCFKCPIARSLNRVLPGLVAEVDQAEISLYEPDEGAGPGEEVYHANMPDNGTDFIWEVDQEGFDHVGPITLTAVFTRL